MASKKLIGSTCAYCGSQPATTREHVFARAFFLKGRRDGLPKAPSCKACNDLKGQLEHHLATLLPFGAKHADALENLSTQVAGRLAKNRRLARALAARAQTEYLSKNGVLVPAMTIPFPGGDLRELAGYWTKGIWWFHRREPLPPATKIEVEYFSEAVGQSVAELLARAEGASPLTRYSANLGDGTVEYTGWAAPASLASHWMYRIYGGPTVSHGDQIEPFIIWARTANGTIARAGE